MTKFFIQWRVNAEKVLDTAGKLHLTMLEIVKAELSAGRLIEWRQFNNGANGYAIAEASEDAVFTTMVRWMPAISFKAVPVHSVDQSIKTLKKAAAAKQA